MEKIKYLLLMLPKIHVKHFLIRSFIITAIRENLLIYLNLIYLNISFILIFSSYLDYNEFTM